MVKLSRIISRVADGDCLKDVSLQTSTENDPFQLFFGRLGSLVQPTKTQTNLPIYMSRKMFINLCCQGGFGHHGSQHGTLALDILRERRLTHLVAGGSICFPFFGQVSLPIVHRNCQIIAEGLGAFVSHTQKKLQLLGNTGKRETQIPNPLRGNRAITKEYNENFLINLSNLLQSKLNHQEKQDTHTQQIRKFTEEDTIHTMILFHPPITFTFSPKLDSFLAPEEASTSNREVDSDAFGSWAEQLPKTIPMVMSRRVDKASVMSR